MPIKNVVKFFFLMRPVEEEKLFLLIKVQTAK